MRISFILACLIYLFSFGVQAQESPQKNKIGLGFYHAQLSNVVRENGQRNWMTSAGWGLNYEYFIHPKFGIGLDLNLIADNFTVENYWNSPPTSLVRNYPLTTCVTFNYKFYHNWSFLMGLGREYAKTGTYADVRFGTEYCWSFDHDFDLAARVTYDIKWSAYQTFMVGFVFSRRFGND